MGSNHALRTALIFKLISFHPYYKTQASIPGPTAHFIYNLMGKPCCLQHNHFVVVLHLGAPWARSEPRSAHCFGAEGPFWPQLPRAGWDGAAGRGQAQGPGSAEAGADGASCPGSGAGAGRQGLGRCGVDGGVGAEPCWPGVLEQAAPMPLLCRLQGTVPALEAGPS